MDRETQQLLAIGSRSLHYFIVIADVGSFSRAAEALRISQPALSRQIKRLEANLGAELLVRHWRGVQLTPSGERLYNQALYLQKQFQELSEGLVEDSHTLRGSVTVALTPTAGQIVPDILHRFMTLHPHVKIVIREGYSDTVQRLLEMGHADIAIFPRYSPSDTIYSDLNIIPLLSEPEYLIGSRFEHDREFLTFAELAQLPLILPVRGNGLRAMLDAIAARENLSLNSIIEADGASLIKTFAIKGLGYTFLPRQSVSQEISNGLLRAAFIRDPEIHRTYVVANHKRRGVSRAAQGLLTMLIETLKTTLPSEPTPAQASRTELQPEAEAEQRRRLPRSLTPKSAGTAPHAKRALYRHDKGRSL